VRVSVGCTMDLIGAFFGTIATWFGFVGACVVGPSAACVPFIAFFALAIAAAAALWLIARAYRHLQGEDEADAEARRDRLRSLRNEQRVRAAVADHVAPRRVGHRGWRMTA
jgi:membrane protein implicated in regulation of membrane protease activity